MQYPCENPLKINDIVRRKDFEHGQFDRYQEGIVTDVVDEALVWVRWPRESESTLAASEALERDEMNPNMATKYAKFIIRNPAEFQSIEIRGVSRICVDGEIHWDMDDTNPEMFSVYARHNEGLCDCVGDFGQYEAALSYAEDLVSEHIKESWDLVDYVAMESQSPGL